MSTPWCRQLTYFRKHINKQIIIKLNYIDYNLYYALFKLLLWDLEVVKLKNCILDVRLFAITVQADSM